MNELNMNKLFDLMKQASNAEKKSVNDNNNINRTYVHNNFEMKVGLDQTYGPPTVEDYKVVQFVTYVYYTMYPMNEGDVYPAAWKDGVVYNYQKIRAERAKLRKSDTKNGMKGMRLQFIVGVLLYCTLIKQQENLMPVPVFVKYLNLALKRYNTKEDRKPIDLQTFERYRTESKPKGIGIKPYLKKVLPSCYNDIEPENMIQFVGFAMLSLKRPEVFRARRIAEAAKQSFSNITPPSNIAIAALYIVAMQNNVRVTHDDFGITLLRLRQSVKGILSAAQQNQRLAQDLQGFILESSPKKKVKISASKK